MSKPRTGSDLTALRHLEKLELLMPRLRMLALKEKHYDLIKELRDYRSDLSWLINEIEKDRCKLS